MRSSRCSTPPTTWSRRLRRTAQAPGKSATHELRVRQTAGSLTSAPSAPSSVTIAPPPTFVAPLQGDTVTMSGFLLEIAGEPGASVQRIKTPDAEPCRPTLMDLDGVGSWSDTFTVPDNGPITIGLRYKDPVSGRFGPAVFIDVDAVP